MGFFRQEYWSGLSFPSPGDLPDLGIEPASLKSPVLAEGFFTTSATWEALSCALMASKPHLLHCHLHLCCCCSVNKSCLTLPPYKLQHARLLCPSLSFFLNFFKFYFIFNLYNIVLVLPNIKMNPPQVYMCSPSWNLLPPPSPYHPFGSFQCTSPKHPVSCIEPGLATRFIHDILHVSMPFSQISHPLPLPQSP